MRVIDGVWIHKEGRNIDGERFSIDALVHGSGRILAKIWHPQADGFEYSVVFYVAIPATILAKPDDAHQFISLESAQHFSEQVVLGFDAIAAPPAVAPVTKRSLRAKVA